MELNLLPKPQSYLARRNLSYRVREFDPSAHQVVGEGHTHDSFNCPFCLDVRGKEDLDGKFYWDRSKFIGYCFKCETVGLLKSDKPISELALQAALIAFQGKIGVQSFTDYKFSKVPYETMFDALDQEGKDYLVSRLPIYTEIFDNLNLRVSPKYGISLPVYIDNELVSYTIRLYNPPTKMKYYIPEGQKYLYSPTNIVSAGNRHSEITICEGPFSAIGAMLDGYPNPIALQGKSITALQLFLIRKIMPSKIFIYLDETALSYDLLRKIKPKLPTCSNFEVVPTNWDPEERLKFRLGRVKSEEDLNLLVSDINKGLSSIRPAKSNGYIN